MKTEQQFKRNALRLWHLKTLVLRRLIDLSTPQLVESSKGGSYTTDWGWIGVKAVVQHNDDPRAIAAAISALVSDGVVRVRGHLKCVQLITA